MFRGHYRGEGTVERKVIRKRKLTKEPSILERGVWKQGDGC